MKSVSYQFARRTNRMKASIIREILKIASRPNVISFAGGLPAPTAFPLKAFERATRQALSEDGTRALQYMVTEGHLGLKEYLCGWLGKQGLKASPAQMMFTHGSQQGLELVGKIFLNPGDKILVEDPTYLGAIQCFNGYEATYVTVPMDESGMQTDRVDALLKKHRIKFIYTVPTFHNPAGITMTLERRKALLAVARRHNVPIIEDDPYGLLRFKGSAVPSLYELARGKGVVYMSTFSKLLSPGIRLGLLIAEDAVMKQLLYAKQATDLQNNTPHPVRGVSLLQEREPGDAHPQDHQGLQAARGRHDGVHPRELSAVGEVPGTRRGHVRVVRTAQTPARLGCVQGGDQGKRGLRRRERVLCERRRREHHAPELHEFHR